MCFRSAAIIVLSILISACDGLDLTSITPGVFESSDDSHEWEGFDVYIYAWEIGEDEIGQAILLMEEYRPVPVPFSTGDIYVSPKPLMYKARLLESGEYGEFLPYQGPIKGVRIPYLNTMEIFGHDEIFVDMSGDGKEDLFLPGFFERFGGETLVNSVLIQIDQQTGRPVIINQFKDADGIELFGGGEPKLVYDPVSERYVFVIDDKHIVGFKDGEFRHLGDKYQDASEHGQLIPEVLPASVAGNLPLARSVSQTGQVQIDLPMELPPGVNGLQPELALRYSSNHRVGIAGAGWGVSGVSELRRCGTAPALGDAVFSRVSLDGSDRLCLGGNRLQVVTGNYWSDGALYKPESDSSVRIRQIGSAQDPSFLLERPDGEHIEFGQQFFPGNSQLPYAWYPDRRVDAFGNELSFDYQVDDHQISVDRIRYGFEQDVEVRFNYEPVRPRESYVAGHRIVQGRALSSVSVRLESQPVWDYLLIYGDDSYDPVSGSLTLEAVQKCGVEGLMLQCLNPTSFDYQSGELGMQSGPMAFPMAETVHHSAILDWQGNGRSDIVTSNGSVVQLHQLGADGQATSTTLAQASSGYQIYALASLDRTATGKGRLIYLEARENDGQFSGVWRIRAHGESAQSFSSFNIELDASSAQIAHWRRFPSPVVTDITGNGMDDVVLVSGNAWRIFDMAGQPQQIATLSGSQLPLSARPSAMSLVSNGSYLVHRESAFRNRYLRISETGAVAGSGVLRASTANGQLVDIPGNRIVPADINGDGYTDIILDNNGVLAIYIADGDGGFTIRATDIPSSDLFIGAPGYEELDKTRYYGRSADLNGNGLDDIIFYNPDQAGGNFKVLYSNGISLDPPVDSGVVSHIRPKLGNIAYLYDVANTSTQHDITADVNVVATAAMYFQNVYVNFQTSQISGQYTQLLSQHDAPQECQWQGNSTIINGQTFYYCTFDIGEMYDSDQTYIDVDLLLQIMSNALGEWQQNAGTFIYPDYPWMWPTSLWDISDVGQIVDSCEDAWWNDIEEQCAFIETYMGFAWPILRAFYQYSAQQISGNFSAAPNLHDFQLLDATGDGVVDILMVNQADDAFVLHYNDARSIRLAAFQDALGRQERITWSALTEEGIYQPTGIDWPERAVPFAGGFPVVSRREVDSGLRDASGEPVFNMVEYRYEDAFRHLDGRGYLGFASKVVTDVEASTETTSRIYQDFPHMGRLSFQERRVTGSDVTIQRSEVEREAIQTDNQVVSVSRRVRQVDEHFNDDGSPYQAEITSVIHDVYQDTFIVPASVKTAVGSGIGSEGELENQIVESTVQHNGWIHRPESWLMGFDSAWSETRKRGEDEVTIAWQRTPYQATMAVQNEIRFAGAPEQIEVSHDYDTFGNVIETATTALLGGAPETRTESVVDGVIAGRYPVRIRNAADHLEQAPREYDLRSGAPTRIVDPNGLVMRWSHDFLGRTLTETDGAGAITQTGYHLCDPFACTGDMQSASYYQSAARHHPQANGVGSPDSFAFFDVRGRKLRDENVSFDGDMLAVDYTYNLLGQLSQQSVPGSAGDQAGATGYQYDVLGREIERQSPEGEVRVTSYEARSEGGLRIARTTTLLDESGSEIPKKHVAEQNSLGETVLTIEDADGLAVITEYGYSPMGLHDYTRVDQRDDLITLLEYDLAGRNTLLDDPDTGVTLMQYSGFGELTLKERANGDTIAFEHDALGRLVRREDTVDGEDPRERRWVYDQDGNGICDGEERVGELVCTVGPGFTERNEYDDLGRLSGLVTRISIADQAEREYQISYQHDLFGRRQSVTWPNDYQASWDYTPEGYLESVQDSDHQELYRITETDHWGNITRAEYAGGAIDHQNSYGTLTGRLESRRTESTHGTLQDDSYGWWSNGNLGQRTLLADGGVLTEVMTYDSLNRLSGAVSSGVVSRSESVDYDRIGNITAKYGVSGSYSYSATQPRAVTSAGGKHFVYDPAGQMTQRDNQQIEYTAFGKPEVFRHYTQEIKRFAYGPDEARFYQRSVQEGVTTETFYIAGSYEEVVTTDSGGSQTLQRVYVGDFLLHSSGDSDVPEYQYLLRDHLGSVTAIAGETGNLLERVLYDPWGGFRSSDGSDGGVGPQHATRGYTDHEHLADLGLIHMNGRVYDPLLGRFLTADPIVQAPFNSQSYNRYSYVWNNPLSRTDPTGYVCVGLSSGGHCAGLDLSSEARYDAVRYWQKIALERDNDAYYLLAAAANLSTADGASTTGSMMLDGLQMKAGAVLTGIHPVLGGSMLIDASSSWMGSVNRMSGQIYGYDAMPPIVDDWVGYGFRHAGEFYFGQEDYGDYARIGLQLGGAMKSAFSRIESPVYSNPNWTSTMFDGSVYGSALRYIDGVPAYQTWGFSEWLLGTYSASKNLYGEFHYSGSMEFLGDDVLGFYGTRVE